MSSPKPIQVPPPSHVKVTKDGRAYADIDVLIDSELERVGVPLPPQNGQQQSHPENQDQNQNSNNPN